MNKIEAVCRDVCQTTEFVTIVTTGEGGPHVVGNWGEYMRALGVCETTLVFPPAVIVRLKRISAATTASNCSSLQRRCRGRAGVRDKDA